MTSSIIAPASDTAAKRRRDNYWQGHNIALRWKSGVISTGEAEALMTDLLAHYGSGDILAGYRDGVDFYSVNEEERYYSRIALSYFQLKGIEG